MGTLVKVDGGHLVSSTPAACSPGTTIEVKSLFFNVPVRRKFQKSPSYDTQAILKVISLLALGYPAIQFELISDQKTLLKTPLINSSLSFNDQLEKRIETVLGKEFTKGLTPVSLHRDPYELKGYIGLPSEHKPNRSHQYLFVNQRAVSSPMISAAIREGYGTMLPTQRYPSFVLHLHLPGSLVDVNVHPQKKEIRLRQEQILKETLIHAVQLGLQRKSAPFPNPDIYPEIEEKLTRPYFSSFTKPNQIEEEIWTYQPTFQDTPPPFLPSQPAENQKETAPFLPFCEDSSSSPKALLTLKGYIVLDSSHSKLSALTKDQPGGLCLLSQKSAYARIFYERLLKQSTQKTRVQPLLIPLSLQFTQLEAQLVKAHLAQLNQMGFSIREFGDSSFVVDAYPDFIQKEDLLDCLNQIVKDLLNMSESSRLQEIKKEKMAWIACRASYPSSKRLSIQEALLLTDQLFACEMPFQCPLGNATLIYWPADELEVLFKK